MTTPQEHSCLSLAIPSLLHIGSLMGTTLTPFLRLAITPVESYAMDVVAAFFPPRALRYVRRLQAFVICC